MMAGQRIDVIFHGCRASGRARGATFSSAAVTPCESLWGENLLCGGGHAVEEETEEYFRIEPGKNGVVPVVGKTVEVAQRFPSFELQLYLPAQLIGLETTLGGQPTARRRGE